MPKVRIEFALPDEQADCRDAFNGAAWRGLVEDVFNHYRAIAKHGEGEAAATAEEVRERISQEMIVRGLDFVE